MITLLEIADLLAKMLGTDDVYAGCIDASKLRQIGVYIRAPSVPRTCIGGASSYQTEHLRILLHWSADVDETQKKAHEIAGKVAEIRSEPTENHTILWTLPKGVNLIGKDEKGICEAVVDADFIYRRNENVYT